MAGLDEDIKAMPMGMNTLISEGSGSISGGQKQRILIARALISNPGILLFDEATSALDNITQKHVADSLSKLGCTRIVIAHRLSTVKDCDRIIVMDRGIIEEEGTYEQLLEKRGLFYELAQRQV
jgi:ABC-type bacteriocin/lantibiotic exporter with double-glycine peptidase domain